MFSHEYWIGFEICRRLPSTQSYLTRKGIQGKGIGEPESHYSFVNFPDSLKNPTKQFVERNNAPYPLCATSIYRKPDNQSALYYPRSPGGVHSGSSMTQMVAKCCLHGLCRVNSLVSPRKTFFLSIFGLFSNHLVVFQTSVLHHDFHELYS